MEEKIQELKQYLIERGARKNIVYHPKFDIGLEQAMIQSVDGGSYAFDKSQISIANGTVIINGKHKINGEESYDYMSGQNDRFIFNVDEEGNLSTKWAKSKMSINSPSEIWQDKDGKIMLNQFLEEHVYNSDGIETYSNSCYRQTSTNLSLKNCNPETMKNKLALCENKEDYENSLNEKNMMIPTTIKESKREKLGVIKITINNGDAEFTTKADLTQPDIIKTTTRFNEFYTSFLGTYNNRKSLESREMLDLESAKTSNDFISKLKKEYEKDCNYDEILSKNVIEREKYINETQTAIQKMQPSTTKKIMSKIDPLENFTPQLITKSHQEIYAESMIDAMENGKIDGNYQPINEQEQVEPNTRSMGFSNLYILGLLTGAISTGLIALGVYFLK